MKNKIFFSSLAAVILSVSAYFIVFGYDQDQPACSSFVVGTKVATESGLKNIERVKHDEKLIGHNLEIGEDAPYAISKISHRKVKKIFSIITVNNQQVNVTPEHLFYVAEKKDWVAAKDLTKADQLFGGEGESISIKSINVVYLKQPVKVYNFEVEEVENYRVTKDLLLVHNGCK